jgi:ABC-type antimicrobial peptide transport system permease subunit
MYRNYFKITCRNLIRNKVFSIINIAGLGLGMACGMLIFLWVKDEYSVDAFHKSKAQLYQVYERVISSGKTEAGNATQGLLAEELKSQIPDIHYAASLDEATMPGASNTFEVNGKVDKMAGKYAGQDFLRMFSYPLIEGSVAGALEMPGSIVISRKMADVFFGSPAGAMGQTIRFENKEDLRVTAVFENVPANSSEQFDFLRTWPDYVAQNPWVNNWGNASPETFVELRSEADLQAVQTKIRDFIYLFKAKDGSSRVELHLRPYSTRYLYGSFKDGEVSGGRISNVRRIMWVGIFILLIACINFMNLATARYVKRSKEAGLRKLIGASRTMLVIQFMGEAMMLALLSAILAVAAVDIILPTFNQITGKQLHIPWSDVPFWGMLTGLALITGIVGGVYPALFLSSMNPIQAIRGKLHRGISLSFLRKALVVFQFTLSVIFIIGVVVIYRQLEYIRAKDLGYDRENLLYIPMEGDLASRYEIFKQQALQLPGILAVSKVRNTPTMIDHSSDGVRWQGMDPDSRINFTDEVVGYDFVRTLKLKVLEGHGFSRQFGTDSTGFLLNETAVREMGLREPIGQILNFNGRIGPVIGVLKDFNMASLHNSIAPLIIRFDEHWSWGYMLVRVSGHDLPGEIAGLKRLCMSLNPAFAFTYTFSDEAYNKLYQSEEVAGRLSDYFAFLAVFISCLGLLGLALFTAEGRIREIGIRKLLGASPVRIAALLSKDTMKLVLVAILIGCPIGWWGARRWLEGFAYHIGVGYEVFLLAATLAGTVAFITTCLPVLGASSTNPVKYLRNER